MTVASSWSGWQDAEALTATLTSGEVHFHSRSRGRLWRKGETSGNTLTVVAVELDCDGDAVLIRARPAGPTCHTGARSCFDEPGAEPAAAHGRRPSKASPGWRRSGPRSRSGREHARPAPTRAGCSMVAWTQSPARSPRRRPRSSWPPRTTRRPRPSGAPRPGRPSPASWPTCCTTPWCWRRGLDRRRSSVLGASRRRCTWPSTTALRCAHRLRSA